MAFRGVSSTMLVTLFVALTILESAITKSIFVCPSEDIETGCKDPMSCIYPDPDNCNGFIQCTDAGEVFYKECNIGLQWNDLIKNCDEPRRSTCARAY